jgi:formylmethanofuran dehydrogenase subunit E
MDLLQNLLDRSAQQHSHLCPRQVLGVRMGVLAGKILDLDLPQKDKRLFTFVECDGCGMGGIAVATGCHVERRTLRVIDYGKLAGTFVDTQIGLAIRIRSHPGSREQALREFSGDGSWQRQLEAYQKLPDEDLFQARQVMLTIDLEKIISKPGLRVICKSCGEEIGNEREVYLQGNILCRGCAGDRYFNEFNSNEVWQTCSSQYNHQEIAVR